MSFTQVEYDGQEKALRGDIVLDGTDIDVAVGGGLQSFDEELSIDGSPIVRLGLVDPQRELVRSGLIDLQRDDDDKLGREVELIVDGIAYWLRQANPTGDTIELTFEDREVCRMRDSDGATKVTPGSVDVRGFLARLCADAGTPELITNDPLAREQSARAAARLGTRFRRDAQQQERDRRLEPGLAEDAGLTVKGAAMTAHQRDEATTLLNEGTRLNAPDLALVSMIFAAIGESAIGGEPGAYGANSSGYGGVMGASAASWDLNDTQGMARAFMLSGRGFHDGAIALAKRYSNPEEIAVRVERPSIWPDNAYADQVGYERFLPEAKAIVAAYTGGALSLSSGAGGTLVQTSESALTVEPGETYWDAARRTADAYNARFFVVANQPYFLFDEALMRSRPRMTLADPRHPAADPRRIVGVDDVNWEWAPRRPLRKSTLIANASLWQAPPGSVVLLDETCGPAGSDADNPNRGRWLVGGYSRSRFSDSATVTLIKGRKPRIPTTTETQTVAGDATSGAGAGLTSLNGTVRITTDGGAKGIVDQLALLCAQVGGDQVYVGSDYRQGSTTTSGNPSDHGSNDAYQAARDIGVRGIDLLEGPPSPLLDRGAAAIGQVFGRDYGNGTSTIIDTFQWNGYRVQIIWRTPLYGGHNGHIHAGVRRA